MSLTVRKLGLESGDKEYSLIGICVSIIRNHIVCLSDFFPLYSHYCIILMKEGTGSHFPLYFKYLAPVSQQLINKYVVNKQLHKCVN